VGGGGLEAAAKRLKRIVFLGQGVLGSTRDLRDDMRGDLVDEILAVAEMAVESALPTPARRATSSSDASGPSSTKTARAADRMRSWLRDASALRHGATHSRASGGRAVSVLRTALLTPIPPPPKTVSQN
jgi:hypothetical protein